MKALTWIGSLALVSVSIGGAQQPATPPKETLIQTSKSRLTLPSLGGLRSENELRQAGAIVEIASGELIADLGDLTKLETALTKEVATYEATRNQEQAAFDKIKKTYDDKLGKYNERLAPLTAEINAFNALPAPQRDPAVHARLAKRKATLDVEYASLQVEKSAGDKAKAEGEARLAVIRDPLQVKINALNAKLGLAYRQLKLCADYAQKINAKLKESYGSNGAHPGYHADGKYPVLDKVIEQLKALASRGFDK